MKSVHGMDSLERDRHSVRQNPAAVDIYHRCQVHKASRHANVGRRPFRLLNVIDDFNREVLSIEADYSLPAERLIRTLNQIISWRGKPKILRCDNGPENVSGAVQTWASKQGIRIEYIQPGQPQQNGKRPVITVLQKY